MLLPVLVETGLADVALRLLMQDHRPPGCTRSNSGATTVWETWEGTTEARFANASHNHYAFGSVAGWMREELAGIRPIAPGYRRIRFAPVITGHLEWVAASVITPFGLAASRWETRAGGGELTVTVPAGSDAEIHTPDGRMHTRGSGTWSLPWATPQPEMPTRHRCS